MKNLLLIHSNISHKNIAELLKSSGIKTWYPLLADYEKILELERSLSNMAACEEISTQLQETANTLRRPFYEATAQLGIKYNSLEWWANNISERNTMKSSIFLHCCYIYIAASMMESKDNLCIITDSNAVIKNIVFLAEKKGFTVKNRSSFSVYDGTIQVLIEGFYKLILNLCIFVLTRLNGLYHRVITGKYKFLKNPDVILHTWVDEKCFGSDGRFKDRYFTVLPDYYLNKGVRKATFVSFSYRNITRSLWEAFSFLHTNQENFIVPEDYYCIRDYWFPFQIRFKQRRFTFQPLLLKGVDCSVLFGEYHKNEPIHFESMYYLLFKSLSDKGIRPKMVMDGFENMFTDKLIQLAVRKFMPGTAVFGFYHVAPPPHVLCFFTDVKERGVVPLPDKIICNGRKYRDILIEEHFPEERIVVGAALRYLYLHNIKKASGSKHLEFRILLVLPIEKDVVIELFYKLKAAIEEIGHFRMILKPHPMQTSVIERIRGNFLPGTEVFTGAMDEALNMCDVVVSAATGAVLDCVMADKEVIRMGRSTQIDLDPLAWFEEFGRPCRGINELREKLIDAEKRIKDPSYEIPHFSALLPELFSPMTEETMSPFLPPG